MARLPVLAELLTDGRVADLFALPAPAFALDARGLRFANPAGLEVLGFATLREAAEADTSRVRALLAQVRAWVDLAPDGAAELRTVEIPDAGNGSAHTFAVARITIAGSEITVLAATNAAPDAACDPVAAATALIGAWNEPLLLLDTGGRIEHCNAAAGALMGAAGSIADIVPGGYRAVVQAREEGGAEANFGVLRVLFRRIGSGRGARILAGLVGPARAVLDTASPPANAVEPAAPAPSMPEPAEVQAAPAAARPPARFVWQTDAAGSIVNVSAELAAVVGEAAAVNGMDWNAATSALGIEGGDAVAAAVARRDTWSGIHVRWPLPGNAGARVIELAALPVFDRERNFLGFRGFGVFREVVARTPVVSEIAAPMAEPEQHAAPPSQREKVVPLRKAPAAEPQRTDLTPGERTAFREIARAIGTRLKRGDATDDRPKENASRASGDGERAVLDRLPLGIVVHRNEQILYANRTLLAWTGLASSEELAARGGLGRLFDDPDIRADEAGEQGRPLTIGGRQGEPIPVEVRLLSVLWEGETALAYVLQRAGAGIDERFEAGELALREAEATARELRAILDTATDGIALLDRDGRVLGMNRSAEALFGFDAGEVEGRNFSVLFAPESHRAAVDYLDGLATDGVASVLNDGREVIGRVREGGLIPLFMTLGRVGDNGQRFCAVFRDMSQWKRAEEELIQARREAERSNSAKSEFLAKISHEIRTPLNAIIGFSEVMMEERLGPIGNDRYREYLKDIHASGEHLVSLINDLLDLSKIEAGKLDLSFASVDLNDIAAQCMAIMQPQANRERIIIRTALAPGLPPVVADARSIRQIALNLLSNSIKFTPPGGQVIVSTTLTEDGEVHLRVRDTGIGMSETEIKTALEPFRQIATSGRGKSDGTGLGLPLTKALVEANRAKFSIRSTVNAGTLVEIAFPSTRVLAE